MIGSDRSLIKQYSTAAAHVAGFLYQGVRLLLLSSVAKEEWLLLFVYLDSGFFHMVMKN